MRLKNILNSFSDFNWDDISIDEQEFEDYKSKYLDLHDKVKSEHQVEKVSILEDVDFELELIHRDEINVTYIVQLLIKLKSKIEQDGGGGDIEKEISNIINTHTQLRSKRELIEKFISQNIPEIEDTDSIPQEFDKFWIEEQRIAFNELVKSENLSVERTEQLIENYLFAEREPLRDEILDLIDGEKPTLLNRKKVGDSILKKIMDFVETFINGMEG
jgi:type I restriction enzyme R subunit